MTDHEEVARLLCECHDCQDVLGRIGFKSMYCKWERIAKELGVVEQETEKRCARTAASLVDYGDGTRTARQAWLELFKGEK